MPNQLIHETSPYLLQHAENPVNWMPWGSPAFEQARKENKPIFLSIGYSACHWCHVMAHESFESRDIALLLNQNFISIKVDREERPDVDSVYMDAVVAMTGSGGWPMSVFLTPEGKPFYGGTYFPPFPRYGMPSFRDVLQAAAKAWRDDPSALRNAGQNLAQHLTDATAWKTTNGVPIRPNLAGQALQSLLGSYDWQRGGWGQAPLFPQPMSVEFLLLQGSRGSQPAIDAASHNLRTMSKGGMYDVVGGGFHRYSTDDAWLVPHFEKMLYDNAQLSSAYLHAYLITKDPAFLRTVHETLEFILRELTSPEGGFYSSLDADSEGEEGIFYSWSYADLQTVLNSSADFDFLCKAYSITPQGNFDGRNILKRTAELADLAAAQNLTVDQLNLRLTQIHATLLAARSQRVHPQTDDKILVSWNALALRVFAEAARYLNDKTYLASAQRNATFLLSELYRDHNLYRAWRAGSARHPAFLEDYAALILGLLSLYQSDPDPRWYSAAVELGTEMVSRFGDPEGGFFDTQAGQTDLFVRPKDNQDNATPCGNSLAVLAILQLCEYDSSLDWRSLAEAPFTSLQDALVRHPAAFGMWLQAYDFLTGPIHQIALIGPLTDPALLDLAGEVWREFRPRTITAAAPPDSETGPSLLRDRPMLAGLPTAYPCKQFTCSLPVHTPTALSSSLRD